MRAEHPREEETLPIFNIGASDGAIEAGETIFVGMVGVGVGWASGEAVDSTEESHSSVTASSEVATEALSPSWGLRESQLYQATTSSSETLQEMHHSSSS
jgi:hypothetical protein